jgi:rhodanese-related sulfurtransferase
MKRISCVIAPTFLAIVVIFSAATVVFGDQDPGIGEYVNVAPEKSYDWRTPPGHFGLMASYADEFFSNGPSNGYYMVTWTFLNDGIDDPLKADELNDFFIVDVRAPADYCKGHLPGAINIPSATLAKPWNLSLLPTQQPILVVCPSGILSSQAVAILGMMGYQVRVLKGGMNGLPTTVLLDKCP